MRLVQLFAFMVGVTALMCYAKPNIVLIMTDDQGYGDLGATGNQVIDTPNLDAMTAKSAQLSRFYVSPVCSPTRACLMTGRYNYRTRCIDTFRGRSNMDTAEVTVAEALKEGGYATGIFGKWHLGDCYPMRPMDQGFDESLIHYGGGLAQPSEPIENNRRYTDPILVRNGTRVQTEGYCSDVYTDAAMTFIERKARARQPFFTYLAFNAPHGPFHDVPEGLRQKYVAKDLSWLNFGKKLNPNEQDKLARICAMIENVDDNVGRLLKKLQYLGIERDTIVIFMIDNGPNTRRFVGNMQGNKSMVHEGGIRSPFIVQWPGTLQPGVASDRIAAHVDVMPTLLDAAGVKPPTAVQFDGVSLMPLLKRQRVDWADRTLFIQTHRGDKPERYHHFAAITQRWKLMRPSGFGRESADPKTPFELYDLQADPKESKNLFAGQPEVAEHLKKSYDAWFDDVSATREDNYAPPRIVVGTPHETETWLTLQDLRAKGRGWGTGGHWPLAAPTEASFQVELLDKEPMPDGLTGTIQAGGVTATGTAKDGKIVIANVSLPTGNFDFSAMVKDDKGRDQLPWQVLLRKK